MVPVMVSGNMAEECGRSKSWYTFRMTHRPIQRAVEKKTARDPDTMAPLALAFIGDTVYDLYIRTMLVDTVDASPHGLHVRASSFACAAGQAEAFHRIEPVLSDEESAVFRRGRNAHSQTVPRNASVSDYRIATGLEALIGWLYLKDREERLDQLFHLILEEKDGGQEPYKTAE